jgi:molybdenum cofactor sulfurtransferase
LQCYFLLPISEPRTTPSMSTADVAPSSSDGNGNIGSGSGMVLKSITLFPIKSCGGQRVHGWPLGARGLLYDRDWTLVDNEGTALNQKRHSRMVMIQPQLDLSRRLLVIHAPDMTPLTIPLYVSSFTSSSPITFCFCGSFLMTCHVM